MTWLKKPEPTKGCKANGKRSFPDDDLCHRLIAVSCFNDAFYCIIYMAFNDVTVCE